MCKICIVAVGGAGIRGLQIAYHLITQKQNSLQAESVTTAFKKVFQRWIKSLKDKVIVVVLCSEPADGRNANTS